jgi:hypothetical protein
MMVRALCQNGRIERVGFQFVRHDERNRTTPRGLADEGPALDMIANESALLGTELTRRGDEALIELGT